MSDYAATDIAPGGTSRLSIAGEVSRGVQIAVIIDGEIGSLI